MHTTIFIVWDPALEDRLWHEHAIDFDSASSMLLGCDGRDLSGCGWRVFGGISSTRRTFLLTGLSAVAHRRVTCRCRHENSQVIRILDAWWADEPSGWNVRPAASPLRVADSPPHTPA